MVRGALVLAVTAWGFAPEGLSQHIQLNKNPDGSVTPWQLSREPLEHVRSEEPWIRAAIRQGLSRSKTFRGLIAALDESDVIVHVIHAPIGRDRDLSLAAYTLNSVIVRGGYRYVRVVIGRKAGDAYTIGTIAHELQHAIEIANNPDVGRTLSAKELFQRINGGGCLGGQCYETLAALNIQDMVTGELLGR